MCISCQEVSYKVPLFHLFVLCPHLKIQVKVSCLHQISLGSLSCLYVGNGSLMAALDAGRARALWLQRNTYPLVKGRASSENVFTPLVFLSFTSFPRFTPSFLYTTFLTHFLSLSYHQSIKIPIPT